MKRNLKTIGLWCIAIGIYVLSCISMWQYNHKAFSKGGQFDLVTPGLMIMFVTYCPLLNTMSAIIWRALDNEYSFANHFNTKH